MQWRQHGVMHSKAKVRPVTLISHLNFLALFAPSKRQRQDDASATEMLPSPLKITYSLPPGFHCSFPLSAHFPHSPFIHLFGCVESQLQHIEGCIMRGLSLQRIGPRAFGLQYLQHVGSLVVAHGLSCSAVYVSLDPQPGIEPASPAFEARLLASGPPGSSPPPFLIVFKCHLQDEVLSDLY